GIDPKRLGAALLGTLRDLVVLRVAPDQPGLVDASDAELEALRAVAERTDAGRLRRMFRALLREQEDLAWAPEPMSVLEVADVQRLLARLDALERRLAGGPPEGAPGGGAGGSGGRPARTPRAGAPDAGPGPTRSRSPRAREDASAETDGRAATVAAARAAAPA